MLEEKVAHSEVRRPRERGNQGFGTVAAGRAIVQLPVGRIVGKALAGAGEIAARVRDEGRHVDHRWRSWVKPVVYTAKVEPAAGVGPINQNAVCTHPEIVERLAG